MKKILLSIVLFCAFYGVANSQVDAPESYTTNYGLRKYADGANAGADSLNKNLDDIDREIKNSRNASNITTGTLSNARLALSVFTTTNLDTTLIMHLDDNQKVTGAKNFDNINNVFKGDGSQLTGVNVSSIIDTARVGFIDTRNSWSKRQLLSDSLRVTGMVNFDSLKVANQTTTSSLSITGDATINGSVTIVSDVTFGGSLNGRGDNLTNLEAGDIASGSLADARLSANVPLKNASNVFTGTTNTFANVKTTALYADPIVIGATTIDCSLGNTFTRTLTGQATFSFTNFATGQIVSVAITGSGGATDADWTGVTWSGGSQPTGTLTTAKTDVWTFIKVGSVIYGSVIQNF